MRHYVAILSVFVLILSSTVVLAQEEIAPRDAIAPGLTYVDAYTIAGDTNFLTDIEPLAADGELNVVVEIPTGTIAKWEVTQPDELKLHVRFAGKDLSIHDLQVVHEHSMAFIYVR